MSGRAARNGPRNGPWITAARALARDRAAMTALVALLLIVLACLAAPVYARRIAHTDPFTSDVAATVMLHGHELAVMQPNSNRLHLGLTPLGPTWHPSAYLLGSDSQGRDVMARCFMAAATRC